MDGSDKRNIVLMIAGTAVIAFFMIWGETYSRQSEQFKLGEKYYTDKDYPKAITAYESALHMYTPGSGKVAKAAERLWEIGENYSKEGDVEMALIAFRSLRSSFYATRSFYTPYPEWIKKSEEQIEQLVKLQEEQEAKEAQAPLPAPGTAESPVEQPDGNAPSEAPAPTTP